MVECCRSLVVFGPRVIDSNAGFLKGILEEEAVDGHSSCMSEANMWGAEAPF